MVSTGLLWKLHLSMITHADCRPPDTKHQLLKSVFMILFYQNTCPGLSSIPSKLFHISPVGSCLGGRDCVCGVAAGVSLNRGYMTRILIPFNRLFDESFPQASLFIPRRNLVLQLLIRGPNLSTSPCILILVTQVISYLLLSVKSASLMSLFLGDHGEAKSRHTQRDHQSLCVLRRLPRRICICGGDTKCVSPREILLGTRSLSCGGPSAVPSGEAAGPLPP